LALCACSPFKELLDDRYFLGPASTAGKIDEAKECGVHWHSPSGMEYPHWLMVTGVVLVVVGFIGFAFQKNAEPPEEQAIAPPEERPLADRHPHRHQSRGTRATDGPCSRAGASFAIGPPTGAALLRLLRVKRDLLGLKLLYQVVSGLVRQGIDYPAP
jgi:hypothetical protein